MKSTWKIIDEEKGKTKHSTDIQSPVTDNNVIMNQNKIANTFNSYFLSIVDSVNSDNNKYINTIITNKITYLSNSFRRPFTKMSWQYTSTYEIKKII